MEMAAKNAILASRQIDPRLAALYRYQIVNTPSERFFRNIAETTAKIFNAELGIVSFIDAENVFYKEVVGANFTGACMPLSQSPCSFAVKNDTVTIMDKYPDKNDPSWGAYHLQVSKFGLKFYAGAPIQTSDGHNIGMLALVDKDPRIFTQRDREILASQAKIVMDELELRLHLLHKSEERFKAVFDQASVGICLSSSEGVLQKVNDRFSQIVGRPADELVGMNFQNLTYSEGLSSVRTSFSNLRAGVPHVTLEVRYLTKSGQIKWAQTSLSLLRDENGNPQQLLAIVEDINERKEAQTKIISQNARLSSITENLAVKNHQLEEYAQIVSHNLRMPAVNISLLTAQLEEAKSTTEVRSLIPYMKKSSEKLFSVLDELNEVLRVKQGSRVEKQNIFFEEAFTNALQMFHSQLIETKAKVTGEFAKAPMITYPKEYLDNIFLNLLSNSLKYRHPKRPPQILFKTAMKGKSLWLKVSDNGSGFDYGKYRHQIFKLGKVFHKNADGQGFGLFMIKNQVETMGGEITVNSDPSKGTIFSINFFKHKQSGEQ